MNRSKKIAEYALYTALAFLFGYLENLFPLPLPFPGMKIGFANLIFVLILYKKGFRYTLSLSLLRIVLSAFTFGGGYVIVTLMKDKFVDKYHWIEENEMLDLIAIAQSAPGAIAVNGAIVVGYKLAGLAGVLTAIFGTVLPPFLIISVISVFYQMFCDNFIISQLLDGMQAGVGAVIASVVWDMAAGITKKKEWTSIVIMAAAFIASYVMEVPVVYIVLICIAMGVIRTVLAGRGGRKK